MNMEGNMTLLKILTGVFLEIGLVLLCWKFVEVYVKYALGGNDYEPKN